MDNTKLEVVVNWKKGANPKVLSRYRNVKRKNKFKKYSTLGNAIS